MLTAFAAVVLAMPAEAACTLAKLADIPVTISGDRLKIPAKINGADAGLMVDSGAFFSSVTSGGAAKYKMEMNWAPSGFYLRGVGGRTGPVQIATARDFSLFGVTLHEVPFFVIENGLGEGVTALLGQNFLGGFDVEYDLPDGVIRLFRTTGCKNEQLAYWATPSTPFSVMDIDYSSQSDLNWHTGGFVTINGVKVHAEFDTGAPTSILTLAAAARAGVKPSDPGVAQVGFTGGIAHDSYLKTWLAPFSSVKIGDNEEIKNFRLFIGATQLDGAADLLIGDDFFLSHRILVSNSQHKLYLSYNGGPVFSTANPPKLQSADGQAQTLAAPASGLDADGYSRRAAAFAAKRDFDDAVADLDHAIELAPNEPRYLFQRAEADVGEGKPELAMADLDQVLKLKPDDIKALLMQAFMYLAQAKADAARVDIDAADKAAAKDPDQRFDIAEAYEAADLQQPAITELDQWIAAHPKDDELGRAFNERCWARALLGQDLDKAAADCKAALRLDPGNPKILDSQGLVRLRSGDLDGSIKDYDAALRLTHGAWSLYGRGLAKLRKGLTNEGQADLKAAADVRADIATTAGKWGLKP